MGEYTFKGLLILVLAVVAFFAFRAGIFWASSNRSSSGKDTTTEQISSDAALEIINVEHEVSDDGVPGMRIYLHCAFNKYKGKTCTLELLFFDGDGNPLPDHNNIACVNGQVGASSDFVVDNVPGEMNVDLFFPYEELDFTSRDIVEIMISARFIIKGKVIAETSLPGLQLQY